MVLSSAKLGVSLAVPVPRRVGYVSTTRKKKGGFVEREVSPIQKLRRASVELFKGIATLKVVPTPTSLFTAI